MAVPDGAYVEKEPFELFNHEDRHLRLVGGLTNQDLNVDIFGHCRTICLRTLHRRNSIEPCFELTALNMVSERGHAGNGHHGTSKLHQPAPFEVCQGTAHTFTSSTDELSDLSVTHRQPVP